MNRFRRRRKRGNLGGKEGGILKEAGRGERRMIEEVERSEGGILEEEKEEIGITEEEERGARRLIFLVT